MPRKWKARVSEGSAKHYWFCLNDTRDQCYLDTNATSSLVLYHLTNLYENTDGSQRLEGLVQFDRPQKRSTVRRMLGDADISLMDVAAVGKEKNVMHRLREKMLLNGGVEWGKYDTRGAGYRTDLHDPQHKRVYVGLERSTTRVESVPKDKISDSKNDKFKCNKQ